MKQFVPRYASIGIVIVAGFGVALYLALQPLRRNSQTSGCQSNLKVIGVAMSQYSRDYDEYYPLTANWADSLKPYTIGSEIYPVGSSDPHPNAAFVKMFIARRRAVFTRIIAICNH